MNDAEIAPRLEAVVAEPIGRFGTVHDLAPQAPSRISIEISAATTSRWAPRRFISAASPKFSSGSVANHTTSNHPSEILR
jgi:hypothetical protein